MDYIELALLGLIVICGIATCVSRNLMVSLIIFMAYSVFMSIVWGMLEAPDLAVTEAAVGAGISGILMFITLKKLHDLRIEGPNPETAEMFGVEKDEKAKEEEF